MILADNLHGLDGIRHAFFTRDSGVSEGLYAGLNCGFGSGDAAARVADNRAIAMARLDLPADALSTVHQVHSRKVVVAEATWPEDARPEADAMVTDRPGVALGILTADCAPVLLADEDAGVIGAAHAGWRGALAGIVEETVGRMLDLGAAAGRIKAAIGPCIAQRSYEVGPEFPAPFVAAAAANEAYFVPAQRDGHFMFDLAGFVAGRLAAAGVAAAERIDADTCADADRFFSYRRATLRREPDYGRGLSAIALAA